MKIQEINFGTMHVRNKILINNIPCIAYECHIERMGYVAVPDCRGIYILEFKNGKYYIGSSYHIDKRMSEHLWNILFTGFCGTKWYKDVRQYINNNGDMKMYIIETDKYKEVELYLINNVTDSLYNKAKTY